MASGFSRKVVNGWRREDNGARCYAMSVRIVALLLVLTLTGPAVSNALCELACAQAAHHQSHAAARGCHEEGAAAGVVALSGTTAAPCHRQFDDAIAILAGSQFPMPLVAALVESLTPLAGDPRLASSGSSGFRLPDRLPIRTQLRI